LVDAAKMQVLDPAASPETRAKVQAKMLSADVLDVARFPRIEFRSRSVTPMNGARLKNAGDALLRIAGDLTLHGQTHPVEFEATGSAGHYRGSAKLKQTDFGIKPITIAGGAVKVKDEVRIDFEILAAAR
jgi:polyisoprenoid-binding protein YceI